MIAQSRIFQLPQALLHEFLDLVRVIHTTKLDRVQVCHAVLAMSRSTATAASSIHAQVGNAE